MWNNFTLLIVLLVIGVVLGLRLARSIIRESAGHIPLREEQAGWLCFIGGSRGPVNVGVTDASPDQRLSDLQSASPQPLRILYATPVRDLEAAEGEAHNLLAENHTNGEWYRREATAGLMWALQREEGTMDALLATKGES